MRFASLAFALLLALPAEAQRAPIVLDGTLTDQRYVLLATDDGGPALGFGSDNQLNALYAHANPATNTLHIGIAGILERNDNVGGRNVAVLFIDSKSGGFGNTSFNRDNGPDFGNGVSRLRNLTFDSGFAADYALQVGCSNTECFFSLYTLSATSSQSTFLGTASGSPNLAADLPVGDQNSRTRGFEVALTYGPAGSGAALEWSRPTIQFFGLITSADGFLSNQTLTPSSSQSNYGFSDVDFSVDSADPVALATADPAEVEGYRLLGSPVIGQTVGDLARLNLVQGVPGQYPDAGANLFTEWTGSGYTRASGTAETLVPGRGFFWQLYNQDINPDPNSFGGGTSRSYALTGGYRLEAGGRYHRTTQTVSFADNSSDFYMVANPFAQPFALGSLTATGGTFSSFVQAWDPAQAPSGGYIPIDRTSGAVAAPWQGYFAEVDGADPAVFTFDAAGIAPDATPPFFGRTAAAPALQLVLGGTLASGEAVGDEAAHVRLSPTASAGWDAEDASKLLPPTATYALVAPVAGRNGEARRAAVTSLPASGEALAVPVVFTTTGAGAFTLAARGADTLPAGWRAELRDLVTGAVADLRAGQTLAFESAAADWTTRFELHLVPDGVVATEAAPAAAVRLLAARPNPTRGSAEAVLELAEPQAVRAVLVDALGREVRVAHDGPAPAGALALRLDTRGLAPGVYVLRATTADGVASQTLTVVR